MIQYCTACGTDSELCTCDDSRHWTDAQFCENCGTICSEEDLDRAGFCEDCEEASQDYEDATISILLAGTIV